MMGGSIYDPRELMLIEQHTAMVMAHWREGNAERSDVPPHFIQPSPGGGLGVGIYQIVGFNDGLDGYANSGLDVKPAGNPDAPTVPMVVWSYKPDSQQIGTVDLTLNSVLRVGHFVRGIVMPYYRTPNGPDNGTARLCLWDGIAEMCQAGGGA